jgi:hypothetical protein
MAEQLDSYRELRVWQAGMSLAEQCYRLTNTFPSNEVYGLSSQIRRAAGSIPANIAEGAVATTYGSSHLPRAAWVSWKRTCGWLNGWDSARPTGSPRP